MEPTPQQEPQISVEEAKRRLKLKYNIEADELEALGFSSNESILKYYRDVASHSSALEAENVEGEDESGAKAPEDSYELTPEQKKELDFKTASRQKKIDALSPKKEKIEPKKKSAPKKAIKAKKKTKKNDTGKNV